MTMPMSIEEKRRHKATVVQGLVRTEKLIRYAIDGLLLSEPDEFDGDFMVMAKNMTLEAQDSCQGIEHALHELIDAPLLETEEETCDS